MDDTTSEATSPYSTSQDQSNDTYQWNIRRQMNVSMLHSQVNQHQILQGEPSEASHQSGPGGRRPKMSETQRKTNKSWSDKKYRQRKKDEMERLSTENRFLKEENGQLRTENRHLTEKTEWLTLEYKCLEERIRGLQGREKCPEEDQQRQDSYISQSASQIDHQTAYVQDHYRMESNNEQAVYMRHHQLIDSNNEGAFDEVDGMGINDLRSLLFSENETVPGGRVAINDPTPEQLEGSRTALSHAEMAMTEFLMKLDAEVPSNIDSSDFTGLEGEQEQVGRYSFPLSLIPTVERIKNCYGDISETSLISPSVSGPIYVLFYAVIKEMDYLQLDQLTENKMLKWRDVIKDAIRLNFKVSFAMEHLKKIACAYFGLPGYIGLQSIDDKISKSEAEVNELKKERAKMYEESKLLIDAAEEFVRWPLSTGLFH